MRKALFLFLILISGMVFSQPTYLIDQSEVVDIFASAEKEILFVVEEINNKEIADSLLNISKQGVQIFIIVKEDSLYQASSYLPSLTLLNGVFAASTIDGIDYPKAIIDGKYVIQGKLLRRDLSVLDRERTFVVSDNEYAIDQRDAFIDLWDRSREFKFDIEMLLHMRF